MKEIIRKKLKISCTDHWKSILTIQQIEQNHQEAAELEEVKDRKIQSEENK